MLTPVIPTNTDTTQSEPSEVTLMAAESHYVTNANSKQVLLAMAVGLKDEDGDVFDGLFEDDRFPTKHRKKWKAMLNDFLGEIKRRKESFGQKPKVNHQMKVKKAIEWLIANPLKDDEEIKFIISQVKDFIETSKNFVQDIKKNTGETIEKGKKWSGIVPHLRLIHCLCDNDEVKAAFQNSFKVMNRVELDGRKNDLLKRNDPWEVMKNFYNDEKFHPFSTAYPTLHDDFKIAIDLGVNEVKDMGVLTSSSAKRRFNKLKNDLLLVKSNWERSGNGDGCLENLKVDEESEELVTEIQQVDRDDKQNFLNPGKNSATLYLWVKSDEHNLLFSVVQELDPSVRIDSSTNNDNSWRKRKAEDEAKMNKLTHSIDKANTIAEENLSISKMRMKQDAIHRRMDEISLLRTQMMETEEKLCMQADKSSPIATLYTTRLRELTAELKVNTDELNNLKNDK